MVQCVLSLFGRKGQVRQEKLRRKQCWKVKNCALLSRAPESERPEG